MVDSVEGTAVGMVPAYHKGSGELVTKKEKEKREKGKRKKEKGK